MVNLKELLSTPRKTASSYAELCPWFSLLPGEKMVLCIDGTILAGFTLPGIDAEGVEDGYLNQQIDILQTALAGMNENVICWSYVDKRKRERSTPSAYGNLIAQEIEDKWLEAVDKSGEWRVEHKIYFAYRKKNLGDSFIDSFNHKVNEENKPFHVALTEAAITSLSTTRTVASIKGHLISYEAEFSKLLQNFNALCSVHLGVRRLEGAELLGDLFERMNPASLPGKVNPAGYSAYLPQKIAADKLVRRGNQLMFEGPSRNKSLSVLSVIDNPDELSSTQIDSLLNLPCEFTICQIFEYMDNTDAMSMIQKMEMHYRMEVKSLGTRVAERISGKDIEKVNTGNLSLADDAQAAVVELTSMNLQYGFHSMRIIAYGETERATNEAVEVIVGAMRANSYVITRETTGLLSSFLSSLPGNSKVNPRKYLSSIANVADLCPIRGFNSGEATNRFLSDVLAREVANHCTFPTESGVPYGFNFHESDLGHTLVLGGSGAGKTTLMNLLLAMFQKYTPCNTYIFDKDYSTSVMSVLLGGQHLDINTSGTTKVRMNPVRRMLSNGDVLALIEWVGMLAVGENGDPLDDREVNEINQVVRQVGAMHQIHWRLSTIYTQLSGVNKKLALRITKYVDISNGEDHNGVGQYSAFFDNDEDAFDITNFVCMETGKLLEIPELAGPFLDYAFYAIDKTLNGSTPTMIYVEECWFALKNKRFYQKLMDWLRTLRKKKGFVTMATQAMSELESLDDVSAFLVNLPTRIFLPSITNTVRENAGLYEQLFNLNEEQLHLLSNAIPKRDYLIVKSSETKLVRAPMPELVIAINNACAVESKREKALELAQTSVHGWQKEYIREVLNVQISS